MIARIELNCTECDWARAVIVDAHMSRVARARIVQGRARAHVVDRGIGIHDVLDLATSASILHTNVVKGIRYVPCETSWGLEGGGNAGHTCIGTWPEEVILAAFNASLPQTDART